MNLRNAQTLLTEAKEFACLVCPEFWRVDRRFRYFITYLFFTPYSLEWSCFLKETHPFVVSLFANRMFLRIYRPYLNALFSTRERFHVLQNHYRFFSELFPVQTSVSVCKNGVLLNRIIIPSAGIFQIRLKNSVYVQEGEMSILLIDEVEEKTIQSLTFTVTSWREGKNTIMIGGLQGGKESSVRSTIHSITKAMYGLRPKSLLLFTLRELCALWEIKRLYAVSTKLQVHNTDKVKDRFFANYNDFWEESGAKIRPDGVYVLPAKNFYREPINIKPQKRSLYRQRYSMMETLKTEILQSFIEATKSNSSMNEYNKSEKMPSNAYSAFAEARPLNPFTSFFSFICFGIYLFAVLCIDHQATFDTITPPLLTIGILFAGVLLNPYAVALWAIIYDLVDIGILLNPSIFQYFSQTTYPQDTATLKFRVLGFIFVSIFSIFISIILSRLQNRKELLQRLFLQLPLPVIISDIKGNIVLVNKLTCDLLKTNAEDVCKMNFITSFSPDLKEGKFINDYLSFFNKNHFPKAKSLEIQINGCTLNANIEMLDVGQKLIATMIPIGNPLIKRYASVGGAETIDANCGIKV